MIRYSVFSIFYSRSHFRRSTETFDNQVDLEYIYTLLCVYYFFVSSEKHAISLMHVSILHVGEMRTSYINLPTCELYLYSSPIEKKLLFEVPRVSLKYSKSQSPPPPQRILGDTGAISVIPKNLPKLYHILDNIIINEQYRLSRSSVINLVIFKQRIRFLHKPKLI